MQPFQRLKNTILMAKRDSLAVILHGKLPPPTGRLAGYLYRRRLPGSMILNSVANKILEKVF
jgi:hypothetical protein